MLKDTNVMRDPLKMIGEDAAADLAKGGFAAILARAGVGKTALLVQLAISALLGGKKVLHVSTDNPVDKVNLWYREVFHRLTQNDPPASAEKRWDRLMQNRFIMTFETETFRLEKLQKRIFELMANGIFHPAQVMIDGFAFSENCRQLLNDLKRFACEKQLVFWFTVRTHRDEPVEPSGIASSFAGFCDLFDLLLQLNPDKDRVYLKRLPNGKGEDIAPEPKAELYLDPATMLISDAPV